LHRISLQYAPYNLGFVEKIGAARGIRTPDLRITKQEIMLFTDCQKFLEMTGIKLEARSGRCWSGEFATHGGFPRKT
jgi:hypothetical protein